MGVKKYFELVPVVFISLMLTAGLWLPQGLTKFIPKCWVQSWFGFPCPGCGLSRSFMELSRGDLLSSFKYNAAGPVLYVIFGIISYDLIRKNFNSAYQPLLSGRWAEALSLFFMLILLAQWAMKMVDYFQARII